MVSSKTLKEATVVPTIQTLTILNTWIYQNIVTNLFVKEVEAKLTYKFSGGDAEFMHLWCRVW